jgi:hypothetical protein
VIGGVTDVLSEGIAESSLRELAVVRDDDRFLVLRVHGELVVVRGDATSEVGLRRGPALVAALRSTRPTATSTSLSSRNRTQAAPSSRNSRR